MAALLLAIGTLVYAFDRNSAVYFLPAWLAHDTGLSLFGPLGDHLPTFIHPLAFILITAAVLRPWPRLLPAICVTWFFVECTFELAQLDPLAWYIAAIVPSSFEAVPWLAAIPNYFLRGTFDLLDIYSIAAGTFTAYLIVHHIETGELQ
jgi:hypothetical protein